MRYRLLDILRALTFISMFLYHALWDLVYLYSADIDWYRSQGAYVWQQSICWTFILLSGFCFSLGKRKIRRGLTVFAAGALVTLVTWIVMPQSPAVFGVLTLLGSSMLLLCFLDRYLGKIPPVTGIAVSFILFLLLREINTGWLGFENLRLAALPQSWYKNLFTAYLGFPAADFVSTDYFSLLPWYFLFLAGYFLCRLMLERTQTLPDGFANGIPLFEIPGRHSLLIYLLHQPLIYGVLTVCHWLF